MRSLLSFLATFSLALAADAPAPLAPIKADVPYAGTTDFRQTLNVYAPAQKPSKPAPVIFWIHGGGWQGGEKTNIQLKPKFFTDLGYVFVSTNHRYVKAVPMNEIFADVAKSLRWTYDHAAEFGGDPNRIVIMGHSSGAQLAAYLAIDERPLKAVGLSLGMFKGCVPVDADTFDIPAVIELATATIAKPRVSPNRNTATAKSSAVSLNSGPTTPRPPTSPSAKASRPSSSSTTRPPPSRPTRPSAWRKR
jgi:acetyl esterase/lipase